LAEAEAEYRTALRLDPNFVPAALVNLADLERACGRDEDEAELLRRAMAIEPDNADVRYGLGNARYAYVYAVALNSSGKAGETLALLDEARQQHPADRSVLMALVSIALRTNSGTRLS
jgi:tetratricopeptide (TPR) repeat protein